MRFPEAALLVRWDQTSGARSTYFRKERRVRLDRRRLKYFQVPEPTWLEKERDAAQRPNSRRPRLKQANMSVSVKFSLDHKIQAGLRTYISLINQSWPAHGDAAVTVHEESHPEYPSPLLDLTQVLSCIEKNKSRICSLKHRIDSMKFHHLNQSYRPR